MLALLRWSTAEATGLHKPHTATEHRFFEPTPPALVMFEPYGACAVYKRGIKIWNCLTKFSDSLCVSINIALSNLLPTLYCCYIVSHCKSAHTGKCS